MAITARALHIPLRVRHREAPSDRVLGDAVWVVATLDGARGVGMEGAAGLLPPEWEPVRPVLQLGAGGRVDTSGVGPHGLGLEPDGEWGG